MSLRASCKTNISDRDALVDTLEEILGNSGVKVRNVQTHNGRQVEIQGYRANDKIEVLVTTTGLYGTAGYAKGKDGNYELIYDSTDRRRLSKLIPSTKNGVTTDLVAQTYAKNKVIRSMKGLRGRIVQNEMLENGSIKIKVKVAQY